jgi:hypothetical protein
MYKPIFLGINDATPGEWLPIFAVIIFLALGLVVTAATFAYFTVYYMIKLTRRTRKNSMRNRQTEESEKKPRLV